MVVSHNCHDDPHAKGWLMTHDTMFGPLPLRRRPLVSRMLALVLLPLLLVLSTTPHPDPLPSQPSLPLTYAVVRRPASPKLRLPKPPALTPLLWRSALAHLAQACILLLLLCLTRLPAASLLLLTLPLLRWLLLVSALVCPCSFSPFCRLLRLALADLHTSIFFALALQLLLPSSLCSFCLAALLCSARPRSPKPSASGRILDDGTYEVVLGEEFAIRHRPVDEFDRRMFLLFLRDIHLVDRPSKWPFVCQVWLADWFGTIQELISRWEDYHQQGDWQRLMSRRDGPLLPLEAQQALIQLWASHLWWSVAEVQTHARSLGLDLSADALSQIGRDSGLLVARRVLRERFHLGPDLLRPQDAWLTQQLFTLLDQFLTQAERGQAPTGAQECRVADLLALRQELGLGSGQELAKPRPWGYRLAQVLCGEWALVDDGSIRCPHRGSDQVRRKSRQGRAKRYYDRQGQSQTVEVYRYYCQNAVCPFQTFTNLPAELVPYSPWRMDLRLVALQAYELGRGSYRSVAQALGLSVATTYRLISQFAGQLLPVAALFGVVRSSGVVGIDEKWVKVPTSQKAAGKNRKWMYVYLAVDVYTYDLLHIAIFPYVGSASAQAFLLRLKAKGYRPQVIVTDLNQDYAAVIAAVFPQAEHHECVFHALQGWHRQIREVYGRNYEKEHPEALELKQRLDHIFTAKTKRTAVRRYEQVLALEERYVGKKPEVAGVFASLERHWPTLSNAIESERIPMTNNATELVIRRFDQHYQNFCGFDAIETAQRYLAVFEWCYRFTPFTADAQQRIRGKCPLELAGYDVQKLPMAQICRGQVLEWPPGALTELVPRV